MPELLGVEETLGDLDAVPCDPTQFEVVADESSGEDLVRGYVYQIHKDRECASRRDRIAREAQLTPEEKRLNAELKSGHRTNNQENQLLPDWKQSAETALEEYRNQRLLLFVEDRQLLPESPAIVIPARATIRFVRIMLLAGG